MPRYDRFHVYGACHTLKGAAAKTGSGRSKSYTKPPPRQMIAECGSPPAARSRRSRRSRAIPAFTALSLNQHHHRARSNGVVDTEHLLFLAGLTNIMRGILTGVDDPVPGLV